MTTQPWCAEATKILDACRRFRAKNRNATYNEYAVFVEAAVLAQDASDNGAPETMSLVLEMYRAGNREGVHALYVAAL